MQASRQEARATIDSMKRELREITQNAEQFRERMGHALNYEEDMTFDDWREVSVFAGEYEILASCICRFARWVEASHAAA